MAIGKQDKRTANFPLICMKVHIMQKVIRKRDLETAKYRILTNKTAIDSAVMWVAENFKHWTFFGIQL